MSIKEFLGQCDQANILFGDHMIWKHSEGWSAVNIKTGNYVLNPENKINEFGWNYWTDLNKLLEKL